MGRSWRWIIEQVPSPGQLGRRLPAPHGASWGDKESNSKLQKPVLSRLWAAREETAEIRDMWEVNRKILSTKRCTCIDRNDVLKHCVPLSVHTKRAGWAAAAVRWNECSSTQEHLCRDIRQGAGCMCLGSDGYRSCREATRPARVCCVQVLNSECLSVHHQGSSWGRIQITTDFTPAKANSK